MSYTYIAEIMSNKSLVDSSTSSDLKKVVTWANDNSIVGDTVVITEGYVCSEVILKVYTYSIHKESNMYTGVINDLIDDIDFTSDDPAEQIEGCITLIETLLAEVDHLQSYIISRGEGVADYQAYLDDLSNVTYH